MGADIGCEVGKGSRRGKMEKGDMSFEIWRIP
jgi:hypothetical protein